MIPVRRFKSYYKVFFSLNRNFTWNSWKSGRIKDVLTEMTLNILFFIFHSIFLIAILKKKKKHRSGWFPEKHHHLILTRNLVHVVGIISRDWGRLTRFTAAYRYCIRLSMHLYITVLYVSQCLLCYRHISPPPCQCRGYLTVSIMLQRSDL